MFSPKSQRPAMIPRSEPRLGNSVSSASNSHRRSRLTRRRLGTPGTPRTGDKNSRTSLGMEVVVGSTYDDDSFPFDNRKFAQSQRPVRRAPYKFDLSDIKFHDEMLENPEDVSLAPDTTNGHGDGAQGTGVMSPSQVIDTDVAFDVGGAGRRIDHEGEDEVGAYGTGVVSPTRLIDTDIECTHRRIEQEEEDGTRNCGEVWSSSEETLERSKVVGAELVAAEETVKRVDERQNGSNSVRSMTLSTSLSLERMDEGEEDEVEGEKMANGEVESVDDGEAGVDCASVNSPSEETRRDVSGPVTPNHSRLSLQAGTSLSVVRESEEEDVEDGGGEVRMNVSVSVPSSLPLPLPVPEEGSSSSGGEPQEVSGSGDEHKDTLSEEEQRPAEIYSYWQSSSDMESPNRARLSLVDASLSMERFSLSFEEEEPETSEEIPGYEEIARPSNAAVARRRRNNSLVGGLRITSETDEMRQTARGQPESLSISMDTSSDFFSVEPEPDEVCDDEELQRLIVGKWYMFDHGEAVGARGAELYAYITPFLSARVSNGSPVQERVLELITDEEKEIDSNLFDQFGFFTNVHRLHACLVCSGTPVIAGISEYATKIFGWIIRGPSKIIVDSLSVCLSSKPDSYECQVAITDIIKAREALSDVIGAAIFRRVSHVVDCEVTSWILSPSQLMTQAEIVKLTDMFHVVREHFPTEDDPRMLRALHLPMFLEAAGFVREYERFVKEGRRFDDICPNLPSSFIVSLALVGKKKEFFGNEVSDQLVVSFGERSNVDLSRVMTDTTLPPDPRIMGYIPVSIWD